jgi:hypothetical protein
MAEYFSPSAPAVAADEHSSNQVVLARSDADA